MSGYRREPEELSFTDQEYSQMWLWVRDNPIFNRFMGEDKFRFMVRMRLVQEVANHCVSWAEEAWSLKRLERREAEAEAQAQAAQNPENVPPEGGDEETDDEVEMWEEEPAPPEFIDLVDEDEEEDPEEEEPEEEEPEEDPEEEEPEEDPEEEEPEEDPEEEEPEEEEPMEIEEEGNLSESSTITIEYGEDDHSETDEIWDDLQPFALR